MLDTAIHVLDILENKSKHIKLKIKWFNRRGMDLNILETIKINKSDFYNWYRL